MKNPNILIFAHSIEPNGTSGSETILIELFRRASQAFKEIHLYTWPPGENLYTRLGLTNVIYHVAYLPIIRWFHLSFLVRCIFGLYLGLKLRLDNPENTYIYPGSDFWPDALPAILVKLRYPTVSLIGTFYLSAPNPFFGFNEGQALLRFPSVNGFFYWFMQIPVIHLFRHFASHIMVTSDPDRVLFPNQKVFIVKGGVDTKGIDEYKKNIGKIDKIWDGVFMGRFHPQKGVLELLDIWSLVINKMPELRLVMIGDGPLLKEVKNKIIALKLGRSVHLTGTLLDKNEKYKLFYQSKIALHPALYDSGGMAAAEIMAFDLPGVAFDLDAYKTYYPKGFMKVPIGRKDLFAEAILGLIRNHDTYTKLMTEAHEMIYTTWSWDLRATEFIEFLKK